MESNTSTTSKSRRRLTLEEKIAKTLERKTEAEKKLKEKQAELKSLAMRKINKDRKERKKLRTHRLIQLGLYFQDLWNNCKEEIKLKFKNQLTKEINHLKNKLKETQNKIEIKQIERLIKDKETQLEAFNLMDTGEEL